MLRVVVSSVAVVVAVAVAVVLVGAGCDKAADTAASAALSAATGVDAKVTTAGGAPQMTANSQQDGAAVALNVGAATTAPAGFPLPVVAGLTLQQSLSTSEGGEARFMVSGTTTKSAKEIADFYEPLLKARGLEVSRNDLNIGGTASVHLSGVAEGRQATVSITSIGQLNMVAITTEGVQ
ncbi:MAG: hypothetical protein FJ137_16460 [Deltaproteobacteria bacterium]|nr:hypothetical protein [Deltaproteobacteria bacterium]